MYFVISANSKTTDTQIMAVATTQSEAFQAMYDVFRANVLLLKGDSFAIPGIEAVGDGWACCMDGIKCCITPSEMLIDCEEVQHWANIVSYDIPLWRLDEKAQEHPSPAIHQTSIFLGEKQAQEEMRRRGVELAQYQRARPPSLRGYRLCQSGMDHISGGNQLKREELSCFLFCVPITSTLISALRAYPHAKSLPGPVCMPPFWPA